MCQGQFAIPHLSRYWSNRLSSHHCLSSHHGTWNCNFSILTHKLTHGDNCDVMAGSLDEDVEKLRQSLNGLPQPQVEPPLIVVSGEKSCSPPPSIRKVKISGLSLLAMPSSKSFWGREYLSFLMPQTCWSTTENISTALQKGQEQSSSWSGLKLPPKWCGNAF